MADLEAGGWAERPLFVTGEYDSVKKVIINEGITSLGERSISGHPNLVRIEIPSTLEDIKNEAFSADVNLTDIYVDSNNPNYESENGILFNKGKTRLIAYPSVKGYYIVPDSVTSIANSAFSVSNLVGIKLPNSITTIEEFTFHRCPLLSSVEILDGVTSIGTWAFTANVSLTKLKIPSSVTYIDIRAFIEDSHLTIQCERGSYADTYAQNRNIKVEYINE